MRLFRSGFAFFFNHTQCLFVDGSTHPPRLTSYLNTMLPMHDDDDDDD